MMEADCDSSDEVRIWSLTLVICICLFMLCFLHGIFKSLRLRDSFSIMFLFMAVTTVAVLAASLLIQRVFCESFQMTRDALDWISLAMYLSFIATLHLFNINRHKTLFKESSMALPTWQYYGYIALTLHFVFTAVLLKSLFVMDFVPWPVLSGLYTLSAVALSALSFRFANVLDKVSAMSRESLQPWQRLPLHNAIVKNLLISFVLALSGFIISVLAFLLSLRVLSASLEMIATLMFVDVAVNTCCVLLTYAHYNRPYQVICGCAHGRLLKNYDNDALPKNEKKPRLNSLNMQVSGMVPQKKSTASQYTMTSPHSPVSDDGAISRGDTLRDKQEQYVKRRDADAPLELTKLLRQLSAMGIIGDGESRETREKSDSVNIPDRLSVWSFSSGSGSPRPSIVEDPSEHAAQPSEPANTSVDLETAALNIGTVPLHRFESAQPPKQTIVMDL